MGAAPAPDVQLMVNTPPAAVAEVTVGWPGAPAPPIVKVKGADVGPKPAALPAVTVTANVPWIPAGSGVENVVAVGEIEALHRMAIGQQALLGQGAETPAMAREENPHDRPVEASAACGS